MHHLIIRRITLLSILLAFAFSVQASGTWIQGGHAGAFYDSEEPGYGVFVEVIFDETSPTGLSVVVAWYAFLDGKQVWIAATGHVIHEEGGQKAVLTAWIYQGNDFPPFYDAAQTLEIPWGEITLIFDGCDIALLTWNSNQEGFGSGEINLQRLTSIAESICNPELGDGVDIEGDDHGNFWQSATAITVKNHQAFVLQIAGDLEYEGDVDVFTFNIHEESEVVIFTLGSSNTVGTLYDIESNRELQLEDDDDSGEGLNFRIVRDLLPGLYSIHVASDLWPIAGDGRYLLKFVVTQK